MLNPNFQYRLSCDVRTAPLRATACINICVHLKSQTLAATPLFGHTKKILHTLTGMGSAAAAVPYPGKATQISHEGQ